MNIPATPSSSQNRNNRLFDVAIIVEGQVANASSADIERVFNLANTELAKKTGQWMRLIEIVNSNVPAASSQQSEKIIQDYVARNAANPPEGIIVLSNDERCKAEGGYAYTLQPAYAFQNEFASPRDGVGDKKIYAAVLELEHPYSRCGYDVYGSGRVSTTSVGGECGNRTGLTCVQNGDLWVCPASLNDLYMNKDYYAASFIINGLLKNFDTEPEATEYRYGTPACTRRLGLGNFDLRISQMYFGVCPDLYARFRPKP